MVVDEQKAAVRANEANEDAKEKKVAEANLAVKQAKLKVFEEKKVEADKKVTEEFAK